ncbi:Phospholipase A2 [Lemmus lemmus]
MVKCEKDVQVRERLDLLRAHTPPSLFLALPRCCQTHDNCYTQAKHLKECKVLIDNPYTNSYSFSCSGNEVTCSAKNNACEAFICNCDREAALCFSKAPYNKENKGIKC